MVELSKFRYLYQPITVYSEREKEQRKSLLRFTQFSFWQMQNNNNKCTGYNIYKHILIHMKCQSRRDNRNRFTKQILLICFHYCFVVLNVLFILMKKKAKMHTNINIVYLKVEKCWKQRNSEHVSIEIKWNAKDYTSFKFIIFLDFMK